ncbi:DUF2158 domain-containing protein [Ruegeria sp. R13_0]|uniref:YodC family protein n=1 Tax=Ruegeria sp. R13_0 TaxID=2821099 RepID=UPI001AD9CB0A|nr:DUF2158 domain-containing protein [Ruegeria sp. R13_0]MBO9432677.1 DUF2158 domain-containing protein [Ruegeria sp. R13_0]
MIEVGDVVELKSGGAKMTVVSVSDNQVECAWQLGNGTPKKEVYPLEAIRGASVFGGFDYGDDGGAEHE